MLCVRGILALYPGAFRRQFGRDALDDIRVDLHAAAARGLPALARAAAATLAAALRDLAAEHHAAWRGSRLHSSASDRKGSSMTRGLDADLRLAARRIRTQPLLAAAVILTLGLAIGASTSIFSVADAVLLRPLPFPQSERLVWLEERTPQGARRKVSLPAVDIWSREAPSLESVAFFESATSLVIVNGEPDRLPRATVSRSFLDVLKVRPALGTGFSSGGLAGAPQEVLISHRLWQRLGGRPELIGTALTLESGDYRIVGVMSPDFSYPAEAAFWATPSDAWRDIASMRGVRFVETIGRLRPDASVEQLREEFAVLTSRFPATDRVDGDVRMTATALHDVIVQHARTGLVTVSWAVAFLLAIACCNVAAIRLVAAVTRRREAAVQSALGAARARLLRQSALEILLIAMPACALGVAIAWSGQGAIVALSLDQIPRIGEASVELRALAFAIAATLCFTLLATVVPAAVLGRIAPATGLGGGAREGGPSPRVLRTLRGLLVAQVALAFVITAGGLLLARTVHQLSRVETGFDAPETVALRLNLAAKVAMSAVGRAFHEDLLRRVRALPEVASAAYAGRLPLSTAVAGSETSAPGEPAAEIHAMHNTAGPGYFATIGARMLEGREIAETDEASGPAVVLNAVLARHLFPSGSAVGRRVVFREMRGPVEARVVGVVQPLRYNGLSGDLVPELFLDYRIRPLPQWLIVRARESAVPLIPALKTLIRQTDPTNRITADPVTTLDAELARHLARPRFFLVLAGTFAVVALALAAVGLYAVMAFSVAQRRHEIGVRLALGATPSRLFASVMRSGVVLTAIGLLLGVAAAAAGVRMMQSLLFGVQPLDPLTFAASTALVVFIAVLACWVPARRARATDPLTVLRVE
jgi:putative ABC transport system permease protein